MKYENVFITKMVRLLVVLTFALAAVMVLPVQIFGYGYRWIKNKLSAATTKKNQIEATEHTIVRPQKAPSTIAKNEKETVFDSHKSGTYRDTNIKLMCNQTYREYGENKVQLFLK